MKSAGETARLPDGRVLLRHELLLEAPEVGGRMMTVALHARWSGQPARAAAVREFVEYARSQPGVRFMRRLDIARFWIDSFGA